jgi:hypothetical protein
MSPAKYEARSSLSLEIDHPSYAYQWIFALNPNWSKFTSPGYEVQRSLKNWAAENDVLKNVKLGDNVESAIRNETQGVWEIKGKTSAGQTFFIQPRLFSVALAA